MSLRLRPLRGEDQTAFLAAHQAMKAEGFVFALSYTDGMSWPAYLARIEGHRWGRDLPEGFVPSTFLAAVAGGELVGRTSIRHQLTEFLEREGGHIGFGVVAAHRRRGYATEILRQSLVIARAAGIDRMLLTCVDSNIGSATVIERCGGVLESRTDSLRHGEVMRRYWIDQ